MIVNRVRGDIFQSPHTHLAFAVNAEGYNDAGFAGAVSRSYWPELANTGGNEFGSVLERRVETRVFHALVVHSLAEGGWDRAPELVEQCLNGLEAPDDEVIGVVLMGRGLIGQMMGADVEAILGAMERSKKKVVVYSL